MRQACWLHIFKSSLVGKTHSLLPKQKVALFTCSDQKDTISVFFAGSVHDARVVQDQAHSSASANAQDTGVVPSRAPSAGGK